MWIAVKSSLTVIKEKGVAFIFHYNYFLCIVHPKHKQPFGEEHSFTYRIISLRIVVLIDGAWFISDYIVGPLLCNTAQITTNFSVIFKIYIGFMVKPLIGLS